MLIVYLDGVFLLFVMVIRSARSSKSITFHSLGLYFIPFQKAIGTAVSRYRSFIIQSMKPTGLAGVAEYDGMNPVSDVWFSRTTIITTNFTSSR